VWDGYTVLLLTKSCVLNLSLNNTEFLPNIIYRKQLRNNSPLFDQLPTFIPCSLFFFPESPSYIFRKKHCAHSIKSVQNPPKLSHLLWHIPMQQPRHKQDSLLSNSARSSHFISSLKPLNKKHPRQLSRYSNRLRTGWPSTPVSILNSSNRLISNPKRPNRLWEPPNLLLNG
jgi:hypothetical protein